MRGLIISLCVLAFLAGLGAFVVLDAVGPDPVQWLLHTMGVAAVVTLLATLAVSTVRRVLHKPALLRWRRPIGLAAFALATLHVLLYLLYQGFAIGPIVEDVLKRPYIMIGMTTWLLLLPLAMTSTHAMQRRLGVRWVQLHRVIYLLVPLAIWHQGMAQKADISQTLFFALLLAGFLHERAWVRWR